MYYPPYAVYYPPYAVFDPYMGIYRAGYNFFVYNAASVLWIISVNNFQFFTNIADTMQPVNYISLERSFTALLLVFVA